jgi:CheY-like chemotaxis protein
MVASKFLKKWGCKYEIAKNGAIGVEMALKGEHDLILMDLQMPVMDGLEATRQIRQSNIEGLKRVPIIALTAGSQSELVLNLEETGLNAFLTKPFSPAKLYQAIAEMAKLGKKGDIAL